VGGGPIDPITAGYSPRSAEVTAARLLKRPEVHAKIMELRDRREERVVITAAWLLERLASLAEVDIAGLLNADGSAKSLSELPADLKRLIAGVEITEVNAGKKKFGYTKKFRLADRIRILELIGKHVDVGALRDRPADSNLMTVVLRDYTGLEHEQKRVGNGEDGNAKDP
jgi:phage terminase small subunit